MNEHIESRYRAVVENQTEMICCFLPDGTITFVNDAYCRFFNKKRKELIGNKFMPFIPKSDRKKVFETISSLSPDAPIATHEHPVLTSDNKLCWHRWTNRAIFNGQNDVLEYQAVGWDITDRKLAEEALQESERKFRSLVETMNDGLGIQNEKGLITYVNDKFCLMLGYKPDDFIGKPVSAFLDDKNKQILKDQISERREAKITPYEIEWNKKDGNKITTIMSPQAIFDEKKQFKGSFAVITDISDLKRAEKALEKAHDELEQRVAERTKELEIKTKSLEELNTAMKVLLEKRKEDRILLEDNVLTNVRELIGPLFDKMRETELNGHQEMILSILETNLNEITSPITRKLSLKHLSLTPTEIKIANLIRHGTTTKKIAEFMNSSPRTIDTHRKNIRRKIGLGKKRANLRSYLLSLH
ncbi:MAG: PAS domain S-box protein [Desulfobacterales bacterium]|nr:MAG: PAS domain S-box protein [Desulfobacterales bacterium]